MSSFSNHHESRSSVATAASAKLLNTATHQAEEKTSVPRALAPSMWLRAMTDFDAPFGRDGLPTVWG